MKKLSLSYSNQKFPTLTELLSKIPNDNNWVWSIKFFYGIGVSPNGMDMPDFEKLVLDTPEGYIISWQELNNFAINLKDIWDLVLVAVKDKNDIKPQEIKKENFSSCILVIEYFDSTEYSLYIQNNDTKMIEWFSDCTKLITEV